MATALDMDLDEIIKKERADKKPQSAAPQKGKTPGSRRKRTSKKSESGETGMDVDEPAKSPRRSRRRGPVAKGRVGKDGGSAINSRLGISSSAAAAILKTTPVAPAKAGSQTIYVSNLDPNASAEDLRTSFQQFGHIIKCTLIYNRQNRPSGNAEITFAKWGSANTAVNTMDGITADGRKLHARLVESAPTAAKASTPAPAAASAKRRVVLSKRGARRRSPAATKKPSTTFKVVL
ncbi:hypothetical protein H4R34_000920 [Dimargaris verticillata]|uniref:RRM domain-containing protein n=1 Tax=Dimargaris verticillata TaxID=2761393 RepID=A0A9W8B6B2_9FUNG|nr:hypothetical protein H4R34_000920 [Dimargaris verticillata]